MRYDFYLYGVYVMDDAEFLDLLNKSDDCPEQLIKMADTPWQKQVAVEFVLTHRKIEERDEKFAHLEKDISWCKWLSVSVFGIVVLSAVAQYIPQLISQFL